MHDQHRVRFNPVEDPTRRLDDLPVLTAAQFAGPGAQLGVGLQVLDMAEYPAHQLPGGLRIIQCDVVGNRIKV